MTSPKKELASGVFYIAVAKYSGILVQLIITAVLARLLAPSDFGIVAVATVIIAFFNILSDIGIGPAIIQKKDLTIEDYNYIYSFTLYVGIGVSFIFFFLSWPISTYYNSPMLIGICQSLSIVLFFRCLSIVPQNLQYKQKCFKFTAFTTLAVQIVSGVASIFAALLGMGLYSLILSQVLSTVFTFIIFYYKEKLKFHFKIRKQSLQKIMSFSVYQFLFNFINYFSRNLDKLMIGRFIGMDALGYYEKSYRLMMLPLSNITFVITPVMQPIFSNFQNNLNEMARNYVKVLRILSFISFPLSVLLFFGAEELIILFFGEQWNDAIEPFKILSLTVAFQILTSTSGSIYQSANATKQLFISGCWCAFFMILSFFVTIWCWGTIKAVAYGFLIAQLFNSAQCFYYLFRTLKYPLINLLRILIQPILIAIIISIIMLLFNFYTSFNNLFLMLILKSIITVLITCSAIQFWGVFDIREWIFQKILVYKK